MSADRELLELAAKAAGYWASEFNCPANLPRPEWDPLADDGDALRLAVKLRLSLICDNDGKKQKVFSGIAPVWSEESRAVDALAATRRAIVRAAAEIGGRAP